MHNRFCSEASIITIEKMFPGKCAASRIFILCIVFRQAASFSYHGENEFGYRYPSKHWTHVPCKPGWNEKESCNTLTGSPGTICLPKSEKYNLTNVCTCRNWAGLTTKNRSLCEPYDLRPECLSGIDACKGECTSQCAILVFTHSIPGLFSIFLAAKMVPLILKAATQIGALHAHTTTLVLAFLCSICVCLWMTGKVLLVIFKDGKYYWSITKIGQGFASTFYIAAILNVSYMWVVMTNAVKQLNAHHATNIEKKQRLILGTGAAFTVSASFFLALSQKQFLLALASFFFSAAVAVHIHLAKNGIVSLMKSMEGTQREAQKKITHVATCIRNNLCFFCLIVLGWALMGFVGSFHEKQFALTISNVSIGLMMLSILYSLHITAFHYVGTMRMLCKKRDTGAVSPAIASETASATNDN